MIPMDQMTMSTLAVTWMNYDVDTDVLPTFLAYRDGELLHVWARVDYEAEAMRNLEDL
jgi:hypothetical protein